MVPFYVCKTLSLNNTFDPKLPLVMNTNLSYISIVISDACWQLMEETLMNRFSRACGTLVSTALKRKSTGLYLIETFESLMLLLTYWWALPWRLIALAPSYKREEVLDRNYCEQPRRAMAVSQTHCCAVREMIACTERIGIIDMTTDC